MNTRGCTGMMAGSSQDQLLQTAAQCESKLLSTRASQTSSNLPARSESGNPVNITGHGGTEGTWECTR